MMQFDDAGGRTRSLVGIELERASQSRTTWTVAGAMVAVAALVAYGAVHPAAAVGAPAAGHEARDALSGVAALRVLVMLLGVLCVTSQYTHGDIVWRYLSDSSRALFVTSKALACAVIGTFLGLAVLQVGGVLAVAHLGAGGLGLSSYEAAHTVLGSVAGMALAGVLGVGVGAAVRSQTAAVVGTLVAVLLVEPLVTAVAPGVGTFLPSAAAAAAAGSPSSLGWAAGLALYATYAVAAAVTGGVLCGRHDL
jgi:hypothetical protein